MNIATFQFTCGSPHKASYLNFTRCSDPFELGLGAQIYRPSSLLNESIWSGTISCIRSHGRLCIVAVKDMLYAAFCRSSPSRELPAARSGSAEVMRVGELNFLPVACLPDQPSISSQIPVDMHLTSSPHFPMTPQMYLCPDFKQEFVA